MNSNATNNNQIAGLTTGTVDNYLKDYQSLLFGNYGDGSPATRTSAIVVPDTYAGLTPAQIAQKYGGTGSAYASILGINENQALTAGQTLNVNLSDTGSGEVQFLQKNFTAAPGGATGSGQSQGGTLFSNIKSMLEPSVAAPAPLNRVQTYQEMSAAAGLPALNQTLTDLKAQQQTEYAQLRVNTAAEQGKPVAMNVIAGRVSEQERAASERIDAIQRQIAYVGDQITTANNTISTIIQLQGLDYQDAQHQYETEFAQNLSTLQLTSGIAKDMITIKQQQQQIAQANLQVYANAITSGNLDPASLSADQKAQLSTLEAQAGLPVGFTASLQLSNKDKIITTSTSNGVTSVVYQDAAGNLSVKKVGTSTASTNPSTAMKKALEADITAKLTLDQLMKKYGNSVSPDVIYSSYNQSSPWGQTKETPEELKAKYNVTTAKAASTTSNADINKAVQLIISKGGSDTDIQKAKTDSDFTNWIIATYGG